MKWIKVLFSHEDPVYRGLKWFFWGLGVLIVVPAYFDSRPEAQVARKEEQARLAVEQAEGEQRYFQQSLVYRFDPLSQTCIAIYKYSLGGDRVAWSVDCCKVRDLLVASVRDKVCPEKSAQAP